MNLKQISFVILLFRIFPSVTEAKDPCTQYFSAIANGFPSTALWIIQMFDASAKLPSGLLDWNAFSIGSFDECIGIRQTFNSTTFRGKYCLVEVNIKEKLLQPNEKKALSALGSDKASLMLGWCVPSVCPITGFTNTIEFILNYTGFVEGVKPFGTGEGMCQTQETLDAEWPAGDWVIIGFLSFILALIVPSTAYDIYIYYTKQDPAHIILLAFSIKSNGKKLLAVRRNPDDLLCLHGIRFISMVCVIWSHSVLLSLTQPLTNNKDLINWIQSPANMYVIGNGVGVDTFLLLSGLLVSYMFHLAKEKGVKFNILLYYFHRYIRLTPALAIVVWIHATIISHVGSGPFWFIGKGILKNPCVKYWWSTLLYIQNYVNNFDTCIAPTWYLSIDTQLFLLSPLLLIPLWRYPRPTVYASIVLVFVSCVSSFLVSWFNELPPTTFPVTAAKLAKYNAKYYQQTYIRYGPWLIGLLLGYVIYKHKRNESSKLKLHPVIVILGWISSVASLLAIVYAPHDIFFSYTNLQASIFNGLHKQCWSLSLCWVIYACIFDYGGPIDKLLSWSVFQVLGKFTYTMYITHFGVIMANVANGRTSGYFSTIHSYHRFWGDMFFTLFFAVCLTLAFESPILVIQKVLFGTDKKKAKQKLPANHDAISYDPEGAMSNEAHTKSVVSD